MLNHHTPIDPILAAIADPARRGMIERLCEGPAPVKRLAEGLPMSLPAVMQHLAVLEGARLITTEKVGRSRMVSLNPAALRQLEGWAAERRREWERRLNRLGDYLDETRRQGETP